MFIYMKSMNCIKLIYILYIYILSSPSQRLEWSQQYYSHVFQYKSLVYIFTGSSVDHSGRYESNRFSNPVDSNISAKCTEKLRKQQPYACIWFQFKNGKMTSYTCRKLQKFLFTFCLPMKQKGYHFITYLSIISSSQTLFMRGSIHDLGTASRPSLQPKRAPATAALASASPPCQ